MSTATQISLFSSKRKREEIAEFTQAIVTALSALDADERIDALNQVRLALHAVSPMKSEPVDCVLWLPAESVEANDYNPNTVAPPEMRLLERSILEDGYTQPVVTWLSADRREVVDGFHRNRVARESKPVSERIRGYLPVVTINAEREDRGDRIAATIRHNRARGKHRVDAMSDIVIELKRRNWSNEKIGQQLGMDPDEVLRLCQITGLVDVFKDADFSQAWDAAIFTEEQAQHISEEDIEALAVDPGRIFHQWDKWECFPAGFYAENPPDGLTTEDCENRYRDFLADIGLFHESLEGVLRDWKYSCEHYLTNERMNRIAWLGQAAVCWKYRIPSRYCGGYNLLTPEQQQAADAKALEFLNRWLVEHGRSALDMNAAQSKTMPDLY